ncbi:MAG TPA: iron ABC transporter permease [Kofleriaceae bacterium]|nr:iron ABC transporter permease [Kofleriaceae bacterium]
MRPRAWVVTGALACVAVGVLAICAGSTGWRAPWAWTAMIGELRAPRVVLGGLVGAALATAGVAMQAVLANDLADPYVLGVSGGASAGAVASLALWPGLAPGPAAAAGATGAALLVGGLARGPHDREHDPARLLLAGVAVGSLLTSATGMLLVLAPGSQLLRSATSWLFGGLGTPRWPGLAAPAIAVAVGVAWMSAQATRIDRLVLGGDVAQALGVAVPRLRRRLATAAVVLTALAVAAAGLVGFVGLIAPHAARRLVGQPHRHVIVLAALAGALLVMAADAVARMAFAPRELPVGLVTASIGGPVFLWQLRRGSR